MGMDICANLTYGIRLPEDFSFKDEEIDIWDALEDLVNPWEKGKEKEYDNLEIILVGFCDEPEFIIATVNHSVDWTAVPISIDELEPRNEKELERFCKDLDIEYDPRWYLSSYYSH